MQIPLFIDSGAHGLYTEHVINKQHRDGYKFYDTTEFKAYLNKYAKFIKTNTEFIDVYANVDVIFHPEKTWEAQKYLEEEHGLTPIPVIHYGTDLKWLEMYLNLGYDYIALGGLGQEVTHLVYTMWADRAFDMICNQASRLPVAKVHGFAMTSHRLLTRYPWYSVDSTSWMSFGAYGFIIYPPRRNNEWRYDKSFLKVKVTPRRQHSGKEIDLFHTYKKEIRQIVLQYIEEKNFQLGQTKCKADGTDEIVEPGLSNDSYLRSYLNALYYIDLTNTLPKWPWPFENRKRGTLL